MTLNRNMLNCRGAIQAILWTCRNVFAAPRVKSLISCASLASFCLVDLSFQQGAYPWLFGKDVLSCFASAKT